MKNVFLHLLLFYFFFCWYTGKESDMNTRAIENFISLPSGSGYFISRSPWAGSSYFIFRDPWDILTCAFVLLFLRHFPKIHKSGLCKIKKIYCIFETFMTSIYEKKISTEKRLIYAKQISLYNFIVLTKTNRHSKTF